MFIPAHALMHYISQESDGRTSLSKDTELHKTKLAEAKWYGLMQKVRERGVETPIAIYNHKNGNKGEPQILDGHHRIVSANHINPNMEIPVKHYNDEYNEGYATLAQIWENQ